MLLNKIILHNFRNLNKGEFVFNPEITIISGENARGKTNILEAVYCLTHGAGFRETKEDELVMFGQTKAKIEGFFINDKTKLNLQVMFNKTKIGLEKKYLINKTIKNFYSFQQEGIKSILFSPEQLEIISGSPEERRQYLDKQISFYDKNYKKKLNNYQNALRKRNKILESYRSEKELEEELFFWDDYLEEQGGYITLKRTEYIKFLNDHQRLDSKSFSVKYQPNLITKHKLKEVFNLEKRYRRTTIGPQKDDFQIYLDKKNIHHFGSRSEHRLAVFWLKINEINYYEKISQKKPILLLDDIFSELDFKNQKLIGNLITHYQTILTTAETEQLELVGVSRTLINI
jgi:DNA replication and repair protein RecF